MVSGEVNALMRMSISVVSHGQGHLVGLLMSDIRKYCDLRNEVLLTLNISEELPFDPDSFPFRIKVIRNMQPKGFAANHNSAFEVANGELFCVLNPDVRLNDDPFPSLCACLGQSRVGVAAPRVMNLHGELEDSVRPFPTPFTILAKVFGCKAGRYPVESKALFPDWVAGMFMLFRSEVYRKVGGFDESYFLYYEDVDICARLRVAGYRAVQCSDVTVVHDARRSSHRSLKYLRWHVGSMLHFFFSPVYRQIYCLPKVDE